MMLAGEGMKWEKGKFGSSVVPRERLTIGKDGNLPGSRGFPGTHGDLAEDLLLFWLGYAS